MQHVLQPSSSETSSLYNTTTFFFKIFIYKLKQTEKKPGKNHLNSWSITLILCYFYFSSLG